MTTWNGLETFDARTVEAVTGVTPNMLRQWDSRGIFTCQIRQWAANQAGLLIGGESQDRRQQRLKRLTRRTRR